MPDSITALVLTDAERLNILQYWPSPEAFVLWQRDTLAAEILRRAQTEAQETSRAVMDAATSGVVEQFPTLFEPQSP